MFSFNLHEPVQTTASSMVDDVDMDTSALEYADACGELESMYTSVLVLDKAFSLMGSMIDTMTEMRTTGEAKGRDMIAFANTMDDALSLLNTDAISMKTECVVDGTESVAPDSNAEMSYLIAGVESIGESMSKAMTRVQEWVEEIIRKIKAFFRTHMSFLGRTVKRLEKIEEKLKDKIKPDYVLKDKDAMIDMGDNAKFVFSAVSANSKMLISNIDDVSGVKEFISVLSDIQSSEKEKNKKGQLKVSDEAIKKCYSAFSKSLVKSTSSATKVDAQDKRLDRKYEWNYHKMFKEMGLFFPVSKKEGEEETLPPMPKFMTIEKKAKTPKGKDRKVAAISIVTALFNTTSEVVQRASDILDNKNEREGLVDQVTDKAKEMATEARKSADSVQDKWKAYSLGKIARNVASGYTKHIIDIERYAVTTLNAYGTYFEKHISLYQDPSK